MLLQTPPRRKSLKREAAPATSSLREVRILTIAHAHPCQAGDPIAVGGRNYRIRLIDAQSDDDSTTTLHLDVLAVDGAAMAERFSSTRSGRALRPASARRGSD